MRKLFIACLAGIIFAPCAAFAEEAIDLPTALNGDWKIVNEQKQELSQGCDKMQRFAVASDGKSILLTEPWANFSATYKVILAEKDRILTVIEGEDRLTDQGDPILWWFYFEDKDHFRFRQYDWHSENATAAIWVRCQPKP